MSLTALSNIIYIELLDKNGEVIIRQILKVGNGLHNGEFLLPAFLTPGTIPGKSFTNWMRNFNQEYFFTKEKSTI